MEERASPPRWALDKKHGEDASMEEKKGGEKSLLFYVRAHMYIDPLYIFITVWRDVSFQKIFWNFFIDNRLHDSVNRLYNHIFEGDT